VGRDKGEKEKQEGKARKVRKAGREGEKSEKQEKEVSGIKCIQLARYRYGPSIGNMKGDKSLKISASSKPKSKKRLDRKLAVQISSDRKSFNATIILI
jgi:hypothetical protein